MPDDEDPLGSVEHWLHRDVIPVYDRMIIDPGRARPSKLVVEALFLHQTRRRLVRERAVGIAPEASEDFADVVKRLTGTVHREKALTLIDRLEAFCGRLPLTEHPGRSRHDVRPHLRIAWFERRLGVAFIVAASVLILGLFQGDPDWETAAL